MYISIITILTAIIAVIGIPNVYAENNGDMFCDGKDRDYKAISELPVLDDGECYSTCEQMSKGLACDIEEREK